MHSKPVSSMSERRLFYIPVLLYLNKRCSNSTVFRYIHSVPQLSKHWIKFIHILYKDSHRCVGFLVHWGISFICNNLRMKSSKKTIKTKSSFEKTKTRSLPRTCGTCFSRNPTLPWLQWRHHSKPRSVHHHPQCSSQIGHFHPEITRCEGNYNGRNDWRLTKIPN